MDDVEKVRLRQLLRRQHGVITLGQARVAGLSEDSVRRRVATKAWRTAGPHTFQVSEHEETPESRTIAAMRSLGDGAVLVGRSAAWWWGLLDTAPARVEVAVDRSRQPRGRAGVEVLRRPVDPVDRTAHRGLTITTRPASVLEAAVRLGESDGARLVDRALVRRQVTLDALREVHGRTSGRRGAVLARRLLVLAAGGARSEAERVAHQSLRRAGIAGWVADAGIALPGFGPVVADLLFEAEKVIVEIDGWAYHRGLRAFLRDGPRQSALVAAGYVVLRTHWYELVDEPDAFLARLRRTLVRRSPSG